MTKQEFLNNREDALRWWRFISTARKYEVASTNPELIDRKLSSLTGREIENLYKNR